MVRAKTQNGIHDIELLSAPLALKDEVRSYCGELERIYGGQLCSIAVIGSAATPDFSAARSDVNILVVFKELELDDLSGVVVPKGSWWRASRLSPRFISRRNLESAALYFPLDFLMMKEDHVTVRGEDILASLVIDKQRLAWHVNQEVKGLRMRLKQQYVCSRGHWRSARRILGSHVTTLLCVCRALLWLRDARVIGGANAVIAKAEQVLRIDGASMAQLSEVRAGTRGVTAENAVKLFGALLHVVRRLDEAAGETA